MNQPIELEFNCPDIDSQAAAILVEETLANAPGVMDASVSLASRVVRVLCRDVEGERTVRRHLSEAGFPPLD